MERRKSGRDNARRSGAAHPELVFPTLKGKLLWRIKEHAAVAFADRIVTVSETAKRDILAWFRMAEDHVVVAHEAADPVFRPTIDDERARLVLEKYGIGADAKFILYVGGLSPHKNLARLIEAFSKANLEGSKLVFVGDFADVFHTHVPELRSTAAAVGIEQHLIMTGFVPDEELVHLYNKAMFLVQPSLMEGFGLPPVEALSCGTPVAYSTAGSLKEVVGDCGISFPPKDVGAMSQALALLSRDPVLRAALSKKAIARSAELTWKKTAEAILDCFLQLESPAGSLARRRSA